MTAAQVQLEETEAGRVVRWRAQELERAGYDAASAAELAERSDIDLHRATGLSESGCPVELALQILL
jgi:hypothetical protein